MYCMFNSVCISVYVKEEVIVDSVYSADLTLYSEGKFDSYVT
jgi:hypothetical protein